MCFCWPSPAADWPQSYGTIGRSQTKKPGAWRPRGLRIRWSCPALCRASTSFLLTPGKQDMDGRGKPGDDDCADQARGRVRIMKVSKVYSATCHQRYSSFRKAIMLS